MSIRRFTRVRKTNSSSGRREVSPSWPMGRTLLYEGSRKESPATGIPDLSRDVPSLDAPTRRKDHHALHQISKLPDIPGPKVGDEDPHGFVGDSDEGAIVAGTGVFDEILHQERDVLLPIPERGELDTKHIQPEIEIPPELPHLHQPAKFLVGGGDDPDVHTNRLLPSDPVELPLFQNPQKLRLGGTGHLPDLVQKDGSRLGQLEKPLPGIDGPGEGTLLVAEQLTLEEGIGESRHIHRNEGFVTSG